MDPLRASDPRLQAAAPAIPAAAIPKDAAAARSLTAAFMVQLETSLQTFAQDSGSDDAGEDPGQDGGFDAGMNATLGMGALGANPGLLAMTALGAPAGNASTGTGLLAALSGGGAAAAEVPAPAPVSGTDRASLAANVTAVANAARSAGAPPELAVAMMLVESGGNNRAVGDNGSSFGLFQLHQGGMLTAAGLTPEQAFDPATNAKVATTSLARELRKDPDRSPGEIAAASQRPANREAYAARVNALLPQARALLGQQG